MAHLLISHQQITQKSRKTILDNFYFQFFALGSLSTDSKDSNDSREDIVHKVVLLGKHFMEDIVHKVVLLGKHLT